MFMVMERANSNSWSVIDDIPVITLEEAQKQLDKIEANSPASGGESYVRYNNTIEIRGRDDDGPYTYMYQIFEVKPII